MTIDPNKDFAGIERRTWRSGGGTKGGLISVNTGKPAQALPASRV